MSVDDVAFEKHGVLLREIILQHSNAIAESLRNSMDNHYYSEVLLKLLSAKRDDELAKYTIDSIISQSNQFENYANKEIAFQKILNLLQSNYFPILWTGLKHMYLNIGEYIIAGQHFKTLLGAHHDAMVKSDGLLFGGDPIKFEVIFSWCKANRHEDLHWIVELLPMFAFREGHVEWHPYAKQFIDEFGDFTNLLDSISAKLGSYFWIGSIVPRLKDEKMLYELSLEHKNPNVLEWAKRNIEILERRIRAENNRDEDGIRNSPGFY